MTREEHIIKWSDKILDHLIGLKEQRYPDLTFWLRTNKHERLTKGYWFLGSHYIMVGLVSRGEWQKRTRQVGLFYDFKNMSKPTIYLSIAIKSETDETIIKCYEEIASKVNNLNRIGQGYYYKEYEEADFLKVINDFLSKDWNIFKKTFEKYGLTETLIIPENVFQNNLKNTIQLRKTRDANVTNVLEEPEIIVSDNQEPIEGRNYWWLNANPKIWSISNHNVGERQSYTTHNEKNNKRRVYRYFEAVKKGDLMIGYESTPTKQIKAVYEITKGIHNTVKGEEIEFKLIEKLEVPIHWNDLKSNPLLESCEVFINNQGSLFKLEENEYEIIRDIIDNKNITAEVLLKSENIKKYKFSEDPDKPFINDSQFQNITSLLKRKKNIILQGPPGVGKTFIARKIAYEIMHEVNDANIEMVQFHQSYSYEDFIQGLRPTTKGTFELRPGIFYSFCQRALQHPNRKFFLIIDEINRGNLSKIFGELMMLIEADKRKEEFALKLTYAEDEDDRFYIPNNLYIIGTMNTADRSLAIVDYALRRRFAFVTLEPNFGDNFNRFIRSTGLSSEIVSRICESIIYVNTKIKDDVNLGEGLQIGHSYFCTYSKSEDEEQWYNDILKYEIKPLLEEIWFDDSSKVSEMMDKMLR